MIDNPPIEIERKFLVASMPDLEMMNSVNVRQGYLTSVGDSVEIRLRQKGSEFFMTLKFGTGLARGEYEISISQPQFDNLWPATEGRRVEKDRYQGRLSDQLIFELDVFTGRLAPLALVEVEFISVAQAQNFAPPAWFGADVTTDERFKNKSLATDGLPELLV